MSWVDRVFRRRRIYDDLSDEIRAHLDERVEELVAGGMSRADAMATARRAFGNITVIQEQGRDTWQWPTLESFLMDVRFSLRQLGHAPALAAIVVLTLGIGIAATTTVFSWTRAILLDPLPGAGDASRVLALESTTAAGEFTPTSWPDFRDLRGALRMVDGLAASYPISLAVSEGPQAERRRGELVSTNFFSVLRVRPALGQFFSPGRDDAEGGDPAVVIAYDLWMRRWHGDSAVIGRVVHVNRFPFSVVGVAPAAFHGSMPGEAIDLWVPATMVGQIIPTNNEMLRDRAWRTFRVLARLGAGVSPIVAREEVARIASTIAVANGERSEGRSATLMPLWQSHWGLQNGLRAPLFVLLGASGLVLLVVCANMANLLLTRTVGRRRELALRLVLGAPRRRLVRQLLTEASILAVAGSGLGLLVTLWLARSLHLLVPPLVAPALLDPRIDAGVLAFTIALSCGVTLVAGIAPALYGSRERFGEALSVGGRGAAGNVHDARVRAMLVVGEMALAVASLVGAGFFYDSFRHTRAVSPGFNADGVAMASVSLTLAGYDSARADGFLYRVADHLRSEPGVSAVSATDYVPLTMGKGSWEDLQVEGYAPGRDQNMNLYRAAIMPDYFRVLQMPLVAGRDFRLDDDSTHTPVMIVNEEFVQRFMRGRTAVGVRVRGWGRWFTIVGVVRNSKVWRLSEPLDPYFYVPIRQVYRPEYGYTFLTRSAGPVDQAARAIEQAVKAADPNIPVFDAMPLATYIGAPLQRERAAAVLLALLAGVALLLAAIGLYGVMARAVAQQTKEIGVRVALGARPADVLRTVASRASLLIVAGLGVGLTAGLALSRIVSSLLFEVNPADLTVFGGAAAGMVAIAVIAVSVPAWRAMRVDPIVALRAD